jgi:exonuclease VII small subunit
MQPTPQQPQQMPVEPKAKEEELERLSEIVKTLETDLEEVKSILV